MKILVTGATGYIGAHVVKRLADHGHKITGTDFNFQQNNIAYYVERLIDWDIRGTRYNRLYMSGFDAVVHLAANTLVAKSTEDPFSFYETNIIGTQNVVDAVPDVGHFLYCSTGTAFDPGSSPYGMSKRAGEDLVTLKPNYSICRFYNVSGNDGFKKFENFYSHLIRKAAAVANGKFDKLQIFGTDYDTPDGTCLRNYSHVADIADAIVAIANNGPTKSIECLGSVNGTSVLEVVAAMEEACGFTLPKEIVGRRSGDIARSTMPQQSRFYTENHTLLEQCQSALGDEK